MSKEINKKIAYVFESGRYDVERAKSLSLIAVKHILKSCGIRNYVIFSKDDTIEVLDFYFKNKFRFDLMSVVNLSDILEMNKQFDINIIKYGMSRCVRSDINLIKKITINNFDFIDEVIRIQTFKGESFIRAIDAAYVMSRDFKFDIMGPHETTDFNVAAPNILFENLGRIDFKIYNVQMDGGALEAPGEFYVAYDQLQRFYDQYCTCRADLPHFCNYGS